MSSLLRVIASWTRSNPLDAGTVGALLVVAILGACGLVNQTTVNVAVLAVLGLIVATLLKLRSDGASTPVYETIEDPGALYAHATELVRSANPEVRNRQIDAVSAPGRDAKPGSDAASVTEAFAQTCLRRLEDGWTVRWIMSIDTPERLHHELGRTLPLGARYELRVLTDKLLPLLSPLVVGRREALLGLDDPKGNGVLRAIRSKDEAAVALVEKYFEQLWNLPDIIVLRDQRGPNGAGIAQLSERLATLSPDVSGQITPDPSDAFDLRAGGDS